MTDLTDRPAIHTMAGEATRAPGTGAGNAQSKALVVFHGIGRGALARLFGCAGFRHCFVCLAHQGSWLRLDFQDGRPALEVVCADSFDLASFYRAAGLTVVAAERWANPARPASLWPLMTASCVGAVKKVLGIGAPFVQTPYQLHRLLTRGQ
jgi:hypothetical protein